MLILPVGRILLKNIFIRENNFEIHFKDRTFDDLFNKYYTSCRKDLILSYFILSVDYILIKQQHW